MMPDRRAGLRYLAVLWLSGCIALSGATWLCFQLGFDLSATGFVFLIVIVLLSLMDSLISSIVFSVFALGSLNYFFADPIFSFQIAYARDLLALAAFLITSLAITTLVRQLHRLGNAQREQARLLDLAHDTVFVRDMSGVITYWNRGAEELYGWKKHEAIGKNAHPLLQTRFPAPFDEINETLLRTGSWEGELVHTKRNGVNVVVASRWSLQQSESGRPLAILETNNDVTERKQAEDALRRSQAQYLAEAQTLSRTGSFGWNVSRGDIFWSDQSFRIFEYDSAITPTIDMVLARVHPDDVAFVKRMMDRAAETGYDYDYEHRLLMPDGSVKHLHVVAHAVRDDPAIRRFVGAIMDVTAARLAERQLREVQAELAHVTRLTALGELSASIAHEVTQPLAAIVTNGEACLRWLGYPIPSPDEVRACVERMIVDGKRAAEIVRRVRQLTRKGASQKTPLDLNEVINDAVSLVQHEVLSHRVSLRLKLTPGLPPLFADRIELQQVILNLVMNGIQAMDALNDRPRELLIETLRDENGCAVAAVHDAGDGIKPESANQLFEPFFTTKPDGMGMGLSICRSIIEAHGGRVWASNHARRGAVFQFSLPPVNPGES
ncbi:PAS domain S-box-containing protein [Paraburkholderia sp. BL23I1N1]|uniref:PAS domain S-box protein n=1 Tax=Paraburkholderia sp. BL23I1N1 TaxID=1938802 RepID=UPI000E756DA2|nr:PAS domain S-box protein [Paraburkholderia sp. BL23I1N1]RKE35755.1 PAS domain S-box-containing protein [Paraburkholderia sp. BL23I1N1]